MARPSPYPAELRERAVRMVAEIRPNYPTEWAAMKAVAAKLGIGAAETVRTWVRKAEVDADRRPGVTSEESAEIKRLKAENAELRRANEILKAASAFFASSRARPATHTLVAFIDESSPTAAPLIVARFTKSQCQPCPARAQCTTSRASHRTVGFPPRELRDLQLRIRAEQQTPEWKTRYAVRSGVEGTVNEFAHGHGMRRCRYRGRGKVHLQHVLTAIAINIERLSGLPATEEAPPATPTDRLPDLPRSARDPPAEVLAHPGHLTPATPRSPTESS